MTGHRHFDEPHAFAFDSASEHYAADRPVRPDHLKLELIFPNGEDRSFTVEIAWVDELPRESPARYDVGLRVLDLDPETRQLLASVLAAQEP